MLLLDNGQSLYDSRVICEYLDVQFNGGLFPAIGADRWEALRLQATADGFCDAAVLVRYEGFVRPQDKQWAGWVDAQLNKCRRALDVLEKECSSFGSLNGNYCCNSSDRPTAVMVVAMYWLERVVIE